MRVEGPPCNDPGPSGPWSEPPPDVALFSLFLSLCFLFVRVAQLARKLSEVTVTSSSPILFVTPCGIFDTNQLSPSSPPLQLCRRKFARWRLLASYGGMDRRHNLALISILNGHSRHLGVQR